jgi:lysophospholipase L1-like esterase
MTARLAAARAARAAVALAAVVVALLTVEVALRVAGASPARFAHLRFVENPGKTVAVDAYPENLHGDLDLDLRDPAVRAPLEAAGVPGLERVSRRTPFGVSFHYNAERCRNPPVGPRTPGTSRVVVIGDSFTEGEGVRAADAFPRRVENLLRGEGRSVEVVNCGRRGHDFPELFADLEPRLVYEPDLVVYAMVLNDAVQSPAFHARQAFLDDWVLDRRRMLGDDEDPGARSIWDSRLGTFVEDRLTAYRVGRDTTRWYVAMYGPDNREGWEATVAFIRAMNEALIARRAHFLVALLPLLVGLPGRYPFEAPAAEIRRACAAAGVPFHDVLDAVRAEPSASLWVHPVDMHPNARAHALFATDLAPVVARVLDGQAP